DINWGQTDGDNECHEPIRYLWYACKNPALRTKAKRFTKIVCRGTPNKVGQIKVVGTTIESTRAYEERDDFKRQKREFEAATGISLGKLGNEDPYHDEEWHKFGRERNPVLNTKSYCQTDTGKEEFKDHSSVFSTYKHQKK